MNTYKSKVDWWLILVFVGIFGFPVIKGVLTEDYLIALIFILVLIGFYFLSKTVKYELTDENLIIWKTKIDIKTIRKIYRTNNPLSSPALSLDRIAIVYNKYDEVLISPKEKNEFINELLKINPAIEVKI